jgi:hypothetical protein
MAFRFFDIPKFLAESRPLARLRILLGGLAGLKWIRGLARLETAILTLVLRLVQHFRADRFN